MFILYLHHLQYCTLVDVIHDIGVWPWDFESKLRRSCTLFQPPGYCVAFMLYLLAFSILEPSQNAGVFPPMILLPILVPVCDDWEAISVYCTDQNKVICMTLWRYLAVLWGLVEESGKLFSFMRSLQAPLDVKGGRRGPKKKKKKSNYR